MLATAQWAANWWPHDKTNAVISILNAIPKLQRYAVAGLGPISGAVSQFILSLLLLRALSASEFGSFSFLLIASLFTAGIWSALFCAPLPALLNSATQENRTSVIRCIFGVSIIGAGTALLLFLGFGLLLGRPLPEVFLFALYVAFFLLRWLARAYSYATGNRIRTMISDITYSVTLLIGIGALFLFGTVTIELAYAIMLFSVVVGLLTFGWPYLKHQFASFYPHAFRDYLPIWRTHSGWSFMGIVTTEATVNAHVYLVTLVAGPAAYAPIAATALMIRPVGVLQNALEEFERAHMAIDIAAGRIQAVRRSVTQFRLMLIAVLLAVALGVTAMFVFVPRIIFPPQYPLIELATGTVLWMLVSATRVIRVPESAMLQAAGAFRPLAWASAVSCGFSVAFVLALLFSIGPIWSIGGIIAGEIAFSLVVLRQSRRWRSKAQKEFGSVRQDHASILTTGDPA